MCGKVVVHTARCKGQSARIVVYSSVMKLVDMCIYCVTRTTELHCNCTILHSCQYHLEQGRQFQCSWPSL